MFDSKLEQEIVSASITLSDTKTLSLSPYVLFVEHLFIFERTQTKLLFFKDYQQSIALDICSNSASNFIHSVPHPKLFIKSVFPRRIKFNCSVKDKVIFKGFLIDGKITLTDKLECVARLYICIFLSILQLSHDKRVGIDNIEHIITDSLLKEKSVIEVCLGYGIVGINPMNSTSDFSAVGRSTALLSGS